MLQTIKTWIRRRQLLTKGDSVLIACSGGADSVALVHAMLQLRSEYSLSLAVAHVHHMLRGQEADRDATFVADFCRRLHLKFFLEKVDVPRYVEETGRSVEDAARQLRYQALRGIAAKLGGAKIATGHHQDDQAETVLLHLLRGAGSTGLCGMAASAAGIIRPFLPVRREEIEAYCRSHDLAFCTDSSNFQQEYRRNRIRWDLIPYLETNYNPAIREALSRTALITADERSYLSMQAQSAWDEVAEEKPGEVEIRCSILKNLHPAIQREIFRMAIEKIQGHLTGISFENVENLVIMALSGQSGSEFYVPGGAVAHKEYDRLRLLLQQQDNGPVGLPVQDAILEIPGVTPLPDRNILVRAEFSDVPPSIGSNAEAVFDWEALTLPLTVGKRIPGDRFQPLGMQGSKKVKDFFIDEKVPRRTREEVPIVRDAQGIVWLAGFRQSDRGKISPNTKTFLKLSIINIQEGNS